MDQDPRRSDRDRPGQEPATAAVMAMCSPHDAALWSAHPDIAQIAIAPGAEAGSDVTLYVWLKADAPGADRDGRRFQRLPPQRPFDLEVGGDGEPHPSFWARCPHLEHLQVMFDPDGDWWGARLWLAAPFRRPEVGAHATAMPFRTDDFAVCVMAEADSLVEDFGEKDGAVDYLDLAKSTERELDRPGGCHLDPADPVYWRAVVSELYRRHSDELRADAAA